MSGTPHPTADDSARKPLLALARKSRVLVRFDRNARSRGLPFVALLTKPGGCRLGTFRSSAAALRWLAGATL